jgi:hypothetical protein
MAFIENIVFEIARTVKERITRDPLFYREEVLSREGIRNIHPEDTIRLVGSDKLFTVKETNLNAGVVRYGDGPRDFFETSQAVRIGCPRGKGHKFVPLGK